MPATTRAKFRVSGVEFNQYQGPTAPKITLMAVSPAIGAPDSPENKSFWNATPQGQITITISNPAAAEVFELGKDYYVDFSQVPAEPSVE